MDNMSWKRLGQMALIMYRAAKIFFQAGSNFLIFSIRAFCKICFMGGKVMKKFILLIRNKFIGLAALIREMKNGRID